MIHRELIFKEEEEISSDRDEWTIIILMMIAGCEW
jgi:hypothetical protein